MLWIDIMVKGLDIFDIFDQKANAQLFRVQRDWNRNVILGQGIIAGKCKWFFQLWKVWDQQG